MALSMVQVSGNIEVTAAKFRSSHPFTDSDSNPRRAATHAYRSDPPELRHREVLPSPNIDLSTGPSP